MPTVITETGAGVAGANSYVDPAGAFATAYFAAHAHASVWNAATTTAREQVVIQATRMLDALYDWNGTRKSSSQALGWPRTGVTVDSESQDNKVPKLLQEATLEQAMTLIAGDRTGESSGGTAAIEEINLGDSALKVVFDSNGETTPPSSGLMITTYVETLLQRLGILRHSGGFHAGIIPVHRV